MISDALNQTMAAYSYTQPQIIAPWMVYLMLGAAIMMIACCGYLVATKAWRKKGRIGKDRKAREATDKELGKTG